ncbi:zinc finger, CCHC-type containing protein [Tanacetum coccineum]
MTTSVVNNSVFRGFFEKQKLTGPNFIDWYRQLRIVLSVEDKLYYLEQPIPPAHVPAQAGQQVAPKALAAHAAWVKGSKEIARLMLMTMEPDIQQNLENLGAYEEGQSVSSYVLKMKSYIDNLERLGHPVSLNLGTVIELHAILKLHEQTLTKKDPALHGLRRSRKLRPGALSLYVGNGQCAAVEAIGSFHLCLPSRLVIVLNNCHYAPSITRRIISVSRLYDDGFVNRFVDNAILVSKNDMAYFSAVLRDSIFEINWSNYNTNDSSMYAVSNKRAKSNLDFALLWHCRLGHISKKRIEKLQHNGLLNSTDLRAFEKCVSCMSGKMARKPYTHQVERAKDLLGLIHTDEHGIIVHRTPPYMPQHNGVSESRNRTLLDMVRFMISQTTLPKSFWDYVLETAACILNMVPTNKGCEALVKLDTLTKADKLEPRSIKCIFVGYPKETMGYSFYYPSENKVLVSQNAEFLENSLITQEASGSLEDLEIIQEEDMHPSINTSSHHEEDDLKIDEPQSDIIPIRRSTRTRHAPDRMRLYVDAEEHELWDLGEPANYNAALLDPESDKWLNAMNVEMQSMKENEV